MDEKRAIAALGGLAQETRLALFRLLVTCGPAGLPAGVIADRIGVQPSSLSFHLAQLVHAGALVQVALAHVSSGQCDFRSPDVNLGPVEVHVVAVAGGRNHALAYLTENCCGREGSCVPACNPADAFTTGENDEAPARARGC